MTLSKRLVAGTMIAALGAGSALPAVSDASTTTVKQTSTYNISVKPGKLAGGADHIRATAVVNNPQSSVSSWYSRSTIQKVVRHTVNGGYQKPFTYQGFRCVPVLNGSMNASTAKFTCKLNGADVSTTVKLTFSVPFKPATA